MSEWKNLQEILNNSCDLNKNRQALIDLENSFTYQQIKDHAENLSNTLKKHNIEADEPIGIIVSNQGWDIINYLAIWNLKGVVVPIHENQSSRSIKSIIQQTDMRIVIKSKLGLWPEGILNEYKKYSNTLCILEEVYPPERELLKGAALVVFTSGSTGIAKGVVLSHLAFASKLKTINHAIPFDKTTTTLLVLQLTFSFGIWVSLLTLARGGLLIMGKKFSPDTINNLILKYSINTVAAVPTMLRAYLNFLDSYDGEKQLKKLREQNLPQLLITGGECLSSTVGKSLRSLLTHCGIADVYGLTETATSDFILLPNEYDNFSGSIGKPSCPTINYQIINDSGSEISDYGVGELIINSPFIMNGYLNQPELTKNSFLEDYFCTGDLARRVKGSDKIEIVGRKKELIYKGGNKISPLEIENIFNEHPGIVCSLVTSVPDEIMGEKIHIFIIAKNKAELIVEDLKIWAKEKIDKYKYPDQYHFISSLPLGSTEKVSRSILKEFLIESNNDKG